MKATTARSTTEINTMSNRIERVAGGSFVRSNSNSPTTGIAMTATIANKEVRLRSLMSNWTVLASADACFHPFALIHTNQAVAALNGIATKPSVNRLWEANTRWAN